MLRFFMCFLLCIGLAVTSVNAASFKKLTKSDVQIQSFTKNKAGIKGWIAKAASGSYFCRVKPRAVTVIVDRKTLMMVLRSGSNIQLDRATFEKGAGPVEGKLPKWPDFKAGRINPKYIGNCTKL